MGLNDPDPIEERDIIKFIEMLDDKQIQKKLRDLGFQQVIKKETK